MLVIGPTLEGYVQNFARAVGAPFHFHSHVQAGRLVALEGGFLILCYVGFYFKSYSRDVHMLLLSVSKR